MLTADTSYLSLPLMKAELIVYKFLSFLLLPIAAFCGFVCLSGLLLALNYPPMLISVFLIACMVIYVIASFIFLTKGIDGNKTCKPVLRDWIRINGVITFIFFLLTMSSFLMIKANPYLMKEWSKQWSEGGNLPAGITVAELQNTMSASINFFLALSIVLLVHILITFHLMRRYRYLFETPRTDTES